MLVTNPRLFAASVLLLLIAAHQATGGGTVQAESQALPAIHYAPNENLEKIDVAMLDGAKSEIDIAAYVLTDVPVIEALTRAADRGVAVKLFLYEDQIADRGRPAAALRDLSTTPGVEVKSKPGSKPLMHLKSYQIDGRLLRTGSANFSASGEKQQDNDLIILESQEAAVAFKHKFEAMWTGASD
jgi:phosphatidylserine/phosphatidylglycerophosphate/cardiolipin synthase-like enzyme